MCWALKIRRSIAASSPLPWTASTPHDISEILASDGVAIRAGHHCAQPLLAHLGHSSTARASLAFYNTEAEIDRLLNSLSTLRERMGYGK